MDEIIGIWTNRMIDLDFVIWNRNKWIECVNIHNMSEISMMKKIKRIIVLEDNYELIKRIYYQCEYKDK
jgi:hypothetical protein